MTAGSKSENTFVCSCADKQAEAPDLTASQRAKNTLRFN